MTELEETLIEVCTRLEQLGVPYMVIGGFAAMIWGEPRLTQDIDITIGVELSQAAELIQKLRPRLCPAVGDAIGFVQETRVIPLISGNGIRIDLLIAGLPYEYGAISRAIPIPIAGREVRICSPEDLVIHKVISERAKDLQDVQSVIWRQGDRFDRSYADPIIRELSQMLDRQDIWDFYQSCFARGGCSLPPS